MRKNFFLAAIMLTAVAITSCTNNKKAGNESNSTDSTQVVDMHTAETSLDYFGEYKGTIPAADCPGINVTLILNKDKTYSEKYEYIDRKDGNFDETGTFEIKGSILTIIPKSGEKSYYKVEEGRVVMLDADQQPVTGALADAYILKQVKVY